MTVPMAARVTLAAAMVALASPASAAMTVAQFLAKVDVLKGKGMMAMFSPDVRVIKSEMTEITRSYRADVEAARASGSTALGCPPPKGKAKLNANQVLGDLRAIPPGERGMSLKAGFYAVMKKRYPCR